MSDYYLRATDEAGLHAVLGAAGVVEEGQEGWYVTDPHQFALDVIGGIYEPTGQTIQTDEGVRDVMQQVPGYHANLRVLEPSEFDPASVASITISTPNSPVRGWA